MMGVAITEQILEALPAIRRTNLEAQMTTLLAERLGLSVEEALELYYSDPLSQLIEENVYGLQYLDAAYLVDELIWRSQQSETCAVSESLRQSGGDDWAERLRNVAVSVGGVELEEPARHSARLIDFGE